MTRIPKVGDVVVILEGPKDGLSGELGEVVKDNGPHSHAALRFLVRHEAHGTFASGAWWYRTDQLAMIGSVR